MGVESIKFRAGPATIGETLLVCRIAGNMELIIKMEAMLELAVGRSTVSREEYMGMLHTDFLELIPRLTEVVGGGPDIPRPFLDGL